jgi:hypothetical protein
MTFVRGGHIIEPLEAGDEATMPIQRTPANGKEIGIIHATVHLEKGFEL